MNKDILIFPHAAGSRMNYINLESNSVRICEYPGHGELVAQELSRNLNDICNYIDTINPDETCWFGHSLGVYIAIASIKHRIDNGLSTPKTLIISAANPPQYLSRYLKGMDISGEGQLARLVKNGHIDKTLTEHPEFYTYLTSCLSSDFNLAAQFSDEFSSDTVRQIMKSINVVIMSGSDDLDVPETIMDKWGAIVNITDKHVLSGNHFYYSSHTSTINEIFSNSMMLAHA